MPDGKRIYEIVRQLGGLARAVVKNQRSARADKDAPMCKTHLDVRESAIRDLEGSNPELAQLFRQLAARAIFVPLDTSRSALEGETRRFQLRRILFPIFMAPLKRDTPIKIDDRDQLVSLLTAPDVFAERELEKSSVDKTQLQLALEESTLRP